MNPPLFSIVIANYNYGRFLADAIESVLAQGISDNVELIVCDAASTDNSVDIIKKYAGGLPPNTDRSEFAAHLSPSPITWWCSEKDGGQSAAFNKGFSHAKGRFLTWLNADDVLMPGALKAVARVIERHPRCEWFTGSSLYVDKDLHVTKWFRSHRFSSLRARWGFLTCGGPSSFFTRRLLEEVGGIDETLHFLMDIDLWYKFYYRCHQKFIRTTAVVFAYRIHEDSKMSGADVKQDDKALRNRQRAEAEYDLLRRRYAIPGKQVVRLATVLSVSWIDKIASVWLTRRHFGERIVP